MWLHPDMFTPFSQAALWPQGEVSFGPEARKLMGCVTGELIGGSGLSKWGLGVAGQDLSFKAWL